jgi:hypothetical protein
LSSSAKHLEVRTLEIGIRTKNRISVMANPNFEFLSLRPLVAKHNHRRLPIGSHCHHDDYDNDDRPCSKPQTKAKPKTTATEQPAKENNSLDFSPDDHVPPCLDIDDQ